jgi:hypothetical protein
MIKQIDRQNIKVIEQAILAKLRESLGSDFGLEFNFKGGNFTPGNAVLKLEVAVKNPDGTIKTRAAEDFKLLCHRFGFKPEHFGATFTVRGTTYKITGLVPKRYSMPISAERVSDGRGFKFPANDVLTHLGEPPVRGRTLSASAPATATERIVIERQIAEMRSNAPENYYADGEHKANGYSEKQIHDMHFDSLLRQLRSGSKLPPMNLFQKK